MLSWYGNDIAKMARSGDRQNTDGEKRQIILKKMKGHTDEVDMKKKNRLDTLVWINEQKEGQAREKVMFLSQRLEGFQEQKQALQEAFVRCESNEKKAEMWEVAHAASQRLVDNIKVIETNILETELYLGKAQDEHREAYSELKAVLRLRDNRFMELKQTEQKKEQKVMDDLAVMMFTRKVAS